MVQHPGNSCNAHDPQQAHQPDHAGVVRPSAIRCARSQQEQLHEPSLKDGDEHQETIKEQPKVSETVALTFKGPKANPPFQEEVGAKDMFGNDKDWIRRTL